MMIVCCFDFEGLFIPEIWEEVYRVTGDEDFRLTTRDYPDFDALMSTRVAALNRLDVGMTELQSIVGNLDLLPGAEDFMQWMQTRHNVIVLTDLMYQLAQPFLQKLNNPTCFANYFVVEDDKIVSHKIRIDDPKKRAVESLQSLNFKVIAAGDSYNDISMIKQADHGFLFNSPTKIKVEFPDLPTVDSFEEYKTAFLEVEAKLLSN